MIPTGQHPLTLRPTLSLDLFSAQRICLFFSFFYRLALFSAAVFKEIRSVGFILFFVLFPFV